MISSPWSPKTLQMRACIFLNSKLEKVSRVQDKSCKTDREAQGNVQDVCTPVWTLQGSQVCSLWLWMLTYRPHQVQAEREGFQISREWNRYSRSTDWPLCLQSVAAHDCDDSWYILQSLFHLSSITLQATLLSSSLAVMTKIRVLERRDPRSALGFHAMSPDWCLFPMASCNIGTMSVRNG